MGYRQAVRHSTLTAAFRWFEPNYPSQNIKKWRYNKMKPIKMRKTILRCTVPGCHNRGAYMIHRSDDYRDAPILCEQCLREVCVAMFGDEKPIEEPKKQRCPWYADDSTITELRDVARHYGIRVSHLRDRQDIINAINEAWEEQCKT